jgi:hypothetical protein
MWFYFDGFYAPKKSQPFSPCNQICFLPLNPPRVAAHLNIKGINHIVSQERGKKGTFGVLGIIYAILAIGILGFVV